MRQVVIVNYGKFIKHHDKMDSLHITLAQTFYYKFQHLLELLQITSKSYYKLRQVLQIAIMIVSDKRYRNSCISLQEMQEFEEARNLIDRDGF